MEPLVDRVVEPENSQRASERRVYWWRGAAVLSLFLWLLVPTLQAFAAPGGHGGGISALEGRVDELETKLAATQADLARESAAREALQAAVNRQATMDLNGDGHADIVTGSGPEAFGGFVKVFSGRDGSVLANFNAFPGSTTRGVSVAAGDVDGDGRADIIAAAATGVSQVKVYSGRDLSLIGNFFAFPGAPVGVSVAGAH